MGQFSLDARRRRKDKPGSLIKDVTTATIEASSEL